MKASAYELCLTIPTHINTSIDSTVCYLLFLIQASLEAAGRARHLPSASLGTGKLGYLRVSSRIPERNFHDSAQNNGVEQHSEQYRKLSNQQQENFIASDRCSNSFEHFLLGYTIDNIYPYPGLCTRVLK